MSNINDLVLDFENNEPRKGLLLVSTNVLVSLGKEIVSRNSSRRNLEILQREKEINLKEMNHGSKTKRR